MYQSPINFISFLEISTITLYLSFTQTNTSNIWNNTHIMMSSVHQVNRAFLSCIARAYAIGEQKDNLKEDHLIKSELVYNYTIQKSYWHFY